MQMKNRWMSLSNQLDEQGGGGPRAEDGGPIDERIRGPDQRRAGTTLAVVSSGRDLHYLGCLRCQLQLGCRGVIEIGPG